VYSPGGDTVSAAGAGQYALSEFRAWSIDCLTCSRFQTESSKQSSAPEELDVPPLPLPLPPSPPISPSRSLKSRSLFANHSFNTSAVTSFPFSRASISGVTPCLSALYAWAPCRRRVLTTFEWPLAAAKWSAVEPDEPTIGAEASRCLSE
jgi:hypothetical protein